MRDCHTVLSPLDYIKGFNRFCLDQGSKRGFLKKLATGRFGKRFTEFDKPSRQAPVAEVWFLPAFDEKDFGAAKAQNGNAEAGEV